ncbi:MAG: SCO family protein [Acidobacteriota bacterium]
MSLRRVLGTLLTVTVLVVMAATPAFAQRERIPAESLPGPLKEVGFDQNLGAQVPLDIPFVDEHGQPVMLADYLGGDKPVVFTFVYYDCPMLCGLVLDGLAQSLSVLPFTPGQEFDVVAVSIAPEETPEMAIEAEVIALERYGKPETAPGWHFLTGGEASIRRLTETAGFRYVFLPETGEYAHASGIMIVTPEGTIAQYFYGVEYPPKDVRLALVDASSNQIGSLVDQMMLFCFQYDPQLGRYTVLITRVLRLAAAAFVLVLAVFLWVMWQRERRTGRTSGPVGAA